MIMTTATTSKMVTRAGQLIRVASLLAAVLLLCAQLPARVDCQEQLSIESRQQKDNEDLQDTIKYLEKLDRYFSQLARPRFGRSEYKQPHRLQPGWSRFAAPSAFGSGAPPTNSGPLHGQLDMARYGSGASELLDLARSGTVY